MPIDIDQLFPDCWIQRLIDRLARVARSTDRQIVRTRVTLPWGPELVEQVTVPFLPGPIEYRVIPDPRAITFDLIVDRTWGPRLRQRVNSLVAQGLSRNEAAKRIHTQIQSIIAATDCN